MCLIVAGWQVHPEYPLIVAANRDEFVARPAIPVDWWPDAPGLLAGRDLEAGGTWMGVSRDGRFAGLTNYRDPAQRGSGQPTRGALVRRALEVPTNTLDTLDAIAAISPDYAGFNLLVGDGRQFGIHESTTGSVRLLEPGIHGLSNHVLNTAWPKVARAQDAFAAALDTLPDSAAFVRLLRDTTPVPDHELPDTGVGLEWERRLSTAFIVSPQYGTRCSSLLTIDHQGQVRFTEWTWQADGTLTNEVTHQFAIDASPGGRSLRP